MKKEIRVYDLHDPQQYSDEKAYWKSKTPEEKLHVLETIRETGYKFLNYAQKETNEDQQRLRRILRIVERS